MTVTIGMDFELQKAMVDLITASADLKTLLGNPVRIYQVPPPQASAVFPYVTVGESQSVPDFAECIDGREIFPVFHIWSRESSFAEAKKISATIWKVLQAGSLVMTENKCLLLEPDGLGDQVLRDPDGITKHIASHYRALCEPL